MAGEGGGYSPLFLFLFPLRYPKEKGKFSIFSTFSSNSSTSGFSATMERGNLEQLSLFPQLYLQNNSIKLQRIMGTLILVTCPTITYNPFNLFLRIMLRLPHRYDLLLSFLSRHRKKRRLVRSLNVTEDYNAQVQISQNCSTPSRVK